MTEIPSWYSEKLFVFAVNGWASGSDREKAIAIIYDRVTFDTKVLITADVVYLEMLVGNRGATHEEAAKEFIARMTDLFKKDGLNGVQIQRVSG